MHCIPIKEKHMIRSWREIVLLLLHLQHQGKHLCYNLPVLETIINNPNARALYMFPTKALAQDQKSEINELIGEAGLNINSYTYDGDTPANIRQKVRKAGHIVITNPDMLHSGHSSPSYEMGLSF